MKKIPSFRSHGGDVRLGKRKIGRTFEPDFPLHVVFRSTRARGAWSFMHRKNRAQIAKIVHETAVHSKVKVLHFVNVGNHLHLIVEAFTKERLQHFLRVVPGKIAFLVTGTRKGNPIGRFWDRLVYTMNFLWDELEILKNYFLKNHFEARGLLQRSKDWKIEKTRLKRLLASGTRATYDDTFW